MKQFRLEDMVRGWFIGSFTPTAFVTDLCEVGVKQYRAGDYESHHHHKIAVEITVVISGQIRMLDKVWCQGDIIVLEPGTITDFEAITDTINVVVKVPGVLGDKYLDQVCSPCN